MSQNIFLKWSLVFFPVVLSSCFEECHLPLCPVLSSPWSATFHITAEGETDDYFDIQWAAISTQGASRTVIDADLHRWPRIACDAGFCTITFNLDDDSISGDYQSINEFELSLFRNGAPVGGSSIHAVEWEFQDCVDIVDSWETIIAEDYAYAEIEASFP